MGSFSRRDVIAGCLALVVMGEVSIHAQDGSAVRHARGPAMPEAVARDLAENEKIIAEALAHPENLEQINSAVPKAGYILKIRATEQGEAWWETVDARRHLSDLQ